MGLLWYTGEKLGDCTIRVVYRTRRRQLGYLHPYPEPPKDPWQAVHTGYEIQILENFPEHHTQREHQKQFDMSWHTTGAIYSISPAVAKPQKRAGEWNTREIELRSPHSCLKVVLVNDFVEGSPVPPRQQNYEPICGGGRTRGTLASRITMSHRPCTSRASASRSAVRQ